MLLERYEFVDLARKVVGVGSVGTRCSSCCCSAATTDDPLFLQVKEAGPSVLEPYLGRSTLQPRRSARRGRASASCRRPATSSSAG